MTDAQTLLERCQTADDLYPALEHALGAMIGHKLFTLMALDYGTNEAARIYTSHPVEYPIGGRKPLGEMTGWGKHVLEGLQPWIGKDADDIRWAFFDHETIAALGCASCLNMPVIDTARADGPKVIGTINLLHEAGWYTSDHIAKAAPFAALLLEPYRAWAKR